MESADPETQDSVAAQPATDPGFKLLATVLLAKGYCAELDHTNT
jgi:hypothetical protein